MILVTITSCKKDIVDPPPIDNLKPGNRNYTWSVDTIKGDPGDLFSLFSLWGSSPTDLWAVGHADASDLSLWHYDGKNWSRNTDRFSHSLMSIYGFAQNDVWATSSPGGIYHYDGIIWTQSYVNSIPGTLPGLDNIWGESTNNIYAVGSIDTVGGGYTGEIVHYDGKKWEMVPIANYRVSFNQIRRGISESNKYYLNAIRFEKSGDTNKIYEFDGVNLTEIYSGEEYMSINCMNEKLYFCKGQKIYKYKNGKFSVWKDLSGSAYLGMLFGRNEKDFFGISANGLAHYNGTDLITIYETNASMGDVLLFENDIFIIFDTRIIVHGTLSSK